jgi:hypothetical protein
MEQVIGNFCQSDLAIESQKRGALEISYQFKGFKMSKDFYYFKAISSPQLVGMI